MNNNNFNSISIAALSLLVAVSTVTISSKSAQAGPFDFIDQINGKAKELNSTVNDLRQTGENTKSAIGNLSDLLGVRKSSTPSSADPNVQALGIYADWYKEMSPSEKEIVNVLTTEYAEKGAIDFASFKATDLYKSKPAAQKTKASALFFKYNELIKAIAPQKDKFLAFAFCVNGGGTNCK
jgi:hypothetical protein